MAPAFKGVGYGMLVISALVCLYYNVIIAWSLFYTFAGMKATLPWSECGHEYNSITCYNKEQAEACNANWVVYQNMTYYDNRCMPVEKVCQIYGQDYSPNSLDQHLFTMCNDGTNDIALQDVSI